MRRFSLLLVILALTSAACAAGDPVATPTTTPLPSATQAPSLTASLTPVTPSPTPTPVIFIGTTSTQVNVRNGPGLSYTSIGLLDPDQPVQVSMLSDDGKWYRISYDKAPEGYGWVNAQFLQFAAGTPNFITPTPQPTRDLPSGRVLQKLNVRSGPGTSFDSLGTLAAGETVVLTARNALATWFQIEYPAGTEQRAWVTAQYIQTEDADGLIVLDEYGNPVSTGTPGSDSLPMTPTVGPAIQDGDSTSTPAVAIIFSSSGVDRFTYSSQVSFPSGDLDDWLEFQPFASLPTRPARLELDLACTGNGKLSIELWQAQAQVSLPELFECGARRVALSLPAGVVYQFHFSVRPGDGLQLVTYSLAVRNLP